MYTIWRLPDDLGATVRPHPNPLPCVRSIHTGEGTYPGFRQNDRGNTGVRQSVVIPYPPMKAKLGTLALAAMTVILFTMAAVHNNDLFWGDTSLLSALRVDNPTWQRFFAGFDTRSTVSLSFILAVAVILWLLRKRLETLVYLFLLPALVVTVTVSKLFVKRLRPEGTLEGMNNSFPSGTATVSILLLGFLIFLVGEFVESRRLRITIQVALGVTIALLGLFRLLAGEHWPSDIYGGYLAGGLMLVVVIWVYRRLRGPQT